MSKNPKVSIVMSSYNHEKFIAKCIESVINQTFQDFEFIIFDDCSTDKTFEIAKKYENEKIKVYKSPYNRGMVQNNNEAIKLSKGEYIANLNSDDFWEPTKLEKQVKFLDENSEYGAVFTDVNLVNEKDKIITDKNFCYFENVENKNRFEWLNYLFYNSNCLCYTSVMIRKKCYDQIGLYNPAYIVLLDLDMWIRICISGYEIHLIKEKLTNFRLLKHERNLGRIRKKEEQGNEQYRILANYLHIKNKEEFSKIFPNYDSQKLENNDIKLYLINIIASEYWQYSDKIITKKSEHRYFKKINSLRESFGTRLIFDYLDQNDQGFNELKAKLNFDFKKYINFTKYRKVVYVKKRLLKILYIFIIILLISVIIYNITNN